MCEITLLALLYSLIVQENEEDEERVTSGVAGALLAFGNADGNLNQTTLEIKLRAVQR